MEAIQTNLFDKPVPSEYFNTTSQSGDDLKKKVYKAKTQSDKILFVFANNPNIWFSPWEIYYQFNERIPITSVRARITVLEQGKYLIKSETAVKCGPYKTPSYSWKLNPNQLK